MRRSIFSVFTLLLLSNLLWSQHKIEGVVKDAEGPLSGALVFLTESNQAAVTDGDGKFSIQNLAAGSYEINVRFVGYKTNQIDVNIPQQMSNILEVEMTPDALGLEEVVVSANRYETDRKNAAVNVGVIGQKIFNATRSVSLAEGLSFQPGIRVETNCQNCGFTQVRLNGLDGPYTQILVNSRPVFSSLIGVYGLEMIPSSMIERVEVVKSGGSALFGSNAIAGTINIITKEPVLNTWEVSSNFASIDGQSNDWVNTANGTYVSNDLNFGISGFINKRNREAYDANGDGFTEMVNLDATTAGIKSYYKVSSNTKLSLDLNYIDEFRRGGNALNLRPEFTDITEQLEHDIFMASLNVDQYLGNNDKLSAYAAFQTTRRDSYYGGLGGERTRADSLLAANAYGVTDDYSLVTGLQWNRVEAKHAFTSGIEYQQNSTEDVIEGYNRLVDQSVSNYGLYGQWEWSVSEGLKLLSGLRYDYSSVDGIYPIGGFDRSIDNEFGVLSPRFTLKYDINDNLQFRGGYARGFRAPQAFNEDLHISSAGGEAVFVLLSDGLTKETSDAFTGSFSYSSLQQSQFSFTVQGFYTQLNNPFVIINTGSQLPNGSILEEVRNGQGATVQGFNLEFNYAPSREFIIQSGFTVQSSEFDETQVIFEPDNPSEGQVIESKRFMRMPNEYGYINATYELNRKWDFSLSNQFTGRMLVPEILQSNGNVVLRNSELFFDTTVKLTHHLDLGKKVHMEINGGVQNLFDSFQSNFQVGPTRDSDFVYGPGRPRTVFFGITLKNND